MRRNPSTSVEPESAEAPAPAAGEVHPLARRLASAAPEIVAAGSYLAAWVAPERLETRFVRLLVLGMLVEFLVIHSSAFLGAVAFGERLGRLKRTLAILGFGAVYLLFAGAFAAAFDSPAPLVTFGWLLGSRLLTVWVDRRERDAERQRQLGLWATSVVCYIVFAILTAIVPLPRLGLDQAAVAALGLPGSGVWVDEPQSVLAFGLLYFGTLAAVELRTR